MGFTLKRFSFQSAKHTIFFSLSMFQNKNACHFTLNSIMFFAFSHLFHLHFSHLIQPLLTVGVTLGIYGEKFAGKFAKGGSFHVSVKSFINNGGCSA